MANVAIIGAGLGGLSTAIALIKNGYTIDIFEKNSIPGGKANIYSSQGFTFDLGPSILSLPYIFQGLFSSAGKRFEDYVTIEELSTHWRCFFENSRSIDLISDIQKQKELFSPFDTKAPKQFEKFIAYAKQQFDIINESYLQSGADSFGEVLRKFSIKDLYRFDKTHTMQKVVQSFFTDKNLQDIFCFFIKYLGSSAYNAPAFLNLLSWVQYGYGLWYIPGGMYNLIRGMQKLLQESGATFHFNSEVTAIETNDSIATGLRLANGHSVKSDIVVCNMEVIPAYERLTKLPPARLSHYKKKFEPSCSGLVLHLGIDRTYPHLAHHNFFFSKNPQAHYHSVFNEHRLPEDPTIYIVAPCKSDNTLAPKGCEIIKLLPHIPHITNDHAYTKEDYETFKDEILTKCERMGLIDLRKHIKVEHCLTPYDIRNYYNSNAGSIYGIVSDLKKNYAFKAPKQSEWFTNLFFVGGSVNPGGGMPMVVLSGVHAAKLICSNLSKQGLH